MLDGVTWPLEWNVIRRNSVSNTFGMVRNYANGTPKPHQGWDFSAAVGTPAFAIADGKVIFVHN
jgi:murein DD-endopeptidase MepM/ murein hydrolase activator NlpD